MKMKLNFLLKSQYWNNQDLKKYQWEKLKTLLKYSYDNVKYYRDILNQIGLKPEDINEYNDFKKIPILTKEDIRSNFDRLLSNKFNKAKLVFSSTSGSTGEPLNFYHDKCYIEWATAARIRSWKYFPGFEKGTFEASLWGELRLPWWKPHIMMSIKRILFNKNYTLNVFNMDETAIRSYFRIYNIIRPTLLRGYASSLYYVAKYLEENGIKIHPPKKIISSAETLYPIMREKIESVFHSQVLDSYGSREVSQVAMECLENQHHIVMENQYVELVGNSPIKDIIVTNLNNFSMPFIRYKVGDVAENIEKGGGCKCGRPLDKLIGLKGRDNENIELDNGKIINGEFFEFLFFGYKSVKCFQVVYHKSSNELELKLMLDHINKDKDLEYHITNEIYKTFHFENIKFRYLDDFEKTKSGKFRFVYSVDD